MESIGHDEEAIRLMDECASLCTRVLGASPPITLSTAEVLVLWKAEKLGMDGGIATVNQS